MSDDRDLQARRVAGEADLRHAGLQNAEIVVADFDPGWRASFATEATRLSHTLPRARLKHIGSTAVQGLAAKPVVDIMALVDDLDAATAAVQNSGEWQFPQAYNATLSRRRWFCKPSATVRTHHLHLVLDEEVLLRHLRFRDALRGSRALRDEYTALKRRLSAEAGTDREAYTAGKTAFVERVLQSS